MEAILQTISHFHALSIDKCMFCLQMPPVFFDSMKIFMLESLSDTETVRRQYVLLGLLIMRHSSYYTNTLHLSRRAEECPKSHQINCADISITECLHKFKTTKCNKLQF